MNFAPSIAGPFAFAIASLAVLLPAVTHDAPVRLSAIYYRTAEEITVTIGATSIEIEDKIRLQRSLHGGSEPLADAPWGTFAYLWAGCLVSEAATEAKPVLPEPDKIHLSLSEGKLASLAWVYLLDRQLTGQPPSGRYVCQVFFPGAPPPVLIITARYSIPTTSKLAGHTHACLTKTSSRFH